MQSSFEALIEIKNVVRAADSEKQQFSNFVSRDAG